jgi:lipid II:glycine glycyltransferase (peptidoglycan interpeptide bridge formation enzyme)
VVISYDKDYSIYWLGFSSENVPNLGQGELLQWEAIKRMKNYGCKYYDLCYIEKDRLPHIYRFKKGFSKNEIEVGTSNKRPISYKIINRINKIF